MSSEVTLRTAASGTLTLKMSELQTTSETLTLTNVGDGLGVDAETLNDKPITDYVNNDLQVSKIVTQSSIPIFSGQLAATTGTAYYQNIYSLSNVGFTHVSDKLTVTVAGTYFFQCSQLISCTASCSMWIRKNGVSQARSYCYNRSTHDLSTQVVVEMAIGDYFQVYYGDTVTSAWSSQHSAVSCFLLN